MFSKWHSDCVAYIGIAFLSIAKYYFIEYIDYILLIHLLVDGHLNCFYFLTILNNATLKNIHVEFFEWVMFSFLWGIYLEVELLGHMVIFMFNLL